MGQPAGPSEPRTSTPRGVGDAAVDPEQSTALVDSGDDASALDPLLAALAATPSGRAEPELAPGTIVGEVFRIERRLGAGGMGVVYLAHDTSLDRPVAVKLHHGGAGLDRLQREATAMARLSHPNVVTVHAVGRFGDDVFVAMEYVGGGTLRSWLKAAPRPWRQALAMCRAAGQGLAAAHAAGLVHRDFKPENVLLTSAGVPKVADFGLARSQGDERPDSVDDVATARSGEITGPTVRGGGAPAAAPSTGSGRKDVLSDRLTRTGVAMGTPAYMAPEQWRGKADVRADQFALAVVLWEALYGERPHAGASTRTLEDAVHAGPPPPPRGAVPPAVGQVLRRALSPAPAARYPDVEALLRGLDRAVGARRRRGLAIAGGLAAIGAVAGAIAAWPRGAADPCARAAAVVEAELSPALVARVERGLAAHGDGGVRAREHLRRTADGLAAVAGRACRIARVEHLMAPELYERAVACLRYRAQVTARLIDDDALLATEPQQFQRRLRAAPRPIDCLDAAALAANPEPPAADAAAVRADLELAAVDVALGRVAEAEAALTRLRDLAGRDRRNQAALAALRGDLAATRGDFAAAVPALTDAYYAGQAIDDVEVYLPALASLISLVGDHLGDAAAAEPWLRAGGVAVERDVRRGAGGVIRVLAALAAAADSRGDSPAAIAFATRARALATDDDDDYAIAVLEQGLAAAYGNAGDAARAVSHGEAAIARCDRALGAEHASCSLMRATLAMGYADREDPAALVTARATQAVLDRQASVSVVDRAYALLNLGVVFTDEPSERGRAVANFIAARALLVSALGPNHPDVAKCDANLAVVAMKEGRYREAVTALSAALPVEERSYGLDHPDVGDAQFNLGTAYLLAGDLDGAARHGERALAIYAAKLPGTVRNVYALRLVAEAKLRAGDLAGGQLAARRGLAMAEAGGGVGVHDLAIEVARANRAAGQRPEETRRLLTAARAHFATAPEIFARQLAAIAALEPGLQ